MGFKWFRARLTFNRPSKDLCGPPGFYRSMSQFDSDVIIPIESSTTQESYVTPSENSEPTAPSPTAYNPMAALNTRETTQILQNNEVKSTTSLNFDSNLTPRLQIQASTNEDMESEEAKYEDENMNDTSIPRMLPRESIELLTRDGSAESSPRQLIAKSRKTHFKQKKAKAPIPRPVSSNGENQRRFITMEESSHASEIEI